MKLPSCPKVIFIDNLLFSSPFFFSAFPENLPTKSHAKLGSIVSIFSLLQRIYNLSMFTELSLFFFNLICLNLPFMSENEHTFLRTRFLEINYCLFSILGKVFVQLYLGLDLHQTEKTGM